MNCVTLTLPPLCPYIELFTNLTPDLLLLADCAAILTLACVSQTYFWTRFPRSQSVCTHTAVIRKSKPERVEMGYSHRVA